MPKLQVRKGAANPVPVFLDLRYKKGATQNFTDPLSKRCRDTSMRAFICSETWQLFRVSPVWASAPINPMWSFLKAGAWVRSWQVLTLRICGPRKTTWKLFHLRVQVIDDAAAGAREKLQMRM